MPSNFSRMEVVASEMGYRVDDHGVVFNSKGRKLNGRDLNGYRSFSVGKVGDCRVHRLSAFQKWGEAIYAEGVEVRHVDDNPSNNTLKNLVLGTHSQNMMDKPKAVRVCMAGNASRKYNHAEIRAFIESGHTYKAAMSKFGIPSLGTISFIINKSLHSLQTNIKPI